MQKLVVTLLFVVTSSFFSNTYTYAQSSKIEGSYSYVAEDEYENDRTGKIKITKTDTEFKVVVSPDAGGTMNLTNVKVKENVLTGSMYMEGNEIDLSMKVEKEKIMGIASLPDGSEVDFTAKRE
jgi:hypothetical protein